MPRKPAGGCRADSCPGRDAGGGYCEKHQSLRPKRPENKWNSTYKLRYGSEWKRIRTMYRRAHPLCEECLKQGRATPAEHVHHIVPLSEGGTNSKDNLMSLCISCHSTIHMRMRAEEKKKKKNSEPGEGESTSLPTSLGQRGLGYRVHFPKS